MSLLNYAKRLSMTIETKKEFVTALDLIGNVHVENPFFFFLLVISRIKLFYYASRYKMKK